MHWPMQNTIILNWKSAIDYLPVQLKININMVCNFVPLSIAYYWPGQRQMVNMQPLNTPKRLLYATNFTNKLTNIVEHCHTAGWLIAEMDNRPEYGKTDCGMLSIFPLRSISRVLQ